MRPCLQLHRAVEAGAMAAAVVTVHVGAVREQVVGDTHETRTVQDSDLTFLSQHRTVT
jgi:hypothetical protein